MNLKTAVSQLVTLSTPRASGHFTGLTRDHAENDLMDYLRVLVTKFHAHGRCGGADVCRCGSHWPCCEEQRLANLVTLIGDACR